MKKTIPIKNPSGKVNTIRRFQSSPRLLLRIFSSLYFLTLTYPSRRRSFRRSFPEHPKIDVRMGVLTQPSGLRAYYAIGKINIVSDWQFEKTGWPDWSLKMLRALFSPINFSCSTFFNLKPYVGTKDDRSVLPADKSERFCGNQETAKATNSQLKSFKRYTKLRNATKVFLSKNEKSP